MVYKLFDDVLRWRYVRVRWVCLDVIAVFDRDEWPAGTIPDINLVAFVDLIFPNMTRLAKAMVFEGWVVVDILYPRIFECLHP